MRCRSMLAALALAAFGLPATAGAETITVQGVPAAMNLADQTSPPPFGPARAEVTMVEGPLEGIAAPDGAVEPRFGTVKVLGKDLRVVLARSAEGVEGFDVLGIDANGDGKIGDGERFALQVTERPLRGGATMLNCANVAFDLPSVGRSLPVAFACSELPGRPPMAHLLLRWYLEGQMKIGAAGYVVSVSDGDSDGRFDGEKDGWVIEVAGPRKAMTSLYGLSTLSEGRFLDGHRFTLTVDEGDKLSVTATPAEGPDPKDLAAQRVRVDEVWRERFDKEREEFIKARSLDTSRPLAERPIAWRYVTLDEARAMAKREGKPLFVDVMAFWCIWCYRMDYYTYPDAEVTSLLDTRFVPVKIIQEQDEAGDYAKLMTELGARGIPAMGVWSPDGALLQTIGGWNAPQAFLASLNEALAKLEK